MKHSNRIGYIAIETVITAALILLAGIFTIMNFSFSGNSFVHTLNERIAGLGIFGGGNDIPGETIVYDDNGYPEHLNINPVDITPENMFLFEWDDTNNGWSIR